jgi:membrane fusion protein (multidrug efflux system)
MSAPLPSAHILILLLALTLAGTACNRKPSDAKVDEKNKDERVPVEVLPVTRGMIEHILPTSTTLEAEAEVKVFSRAANLVTELLVEEGDRVEKDQVLVRLEDDTQTTQVNKAENLLDQARQEFERQKSLHDQNLISDQVFSDARFKFRELELSLEESRRQLDYTEVRAPIAGTVTRRLVKLGDHVTVNQNLFDIVDFDSMVAPIHIPDRFVTQLAPGQTTRVRAEALGERVFPGYVKRISPIVQARSGTIKVTVGLKDPGPLRPGMHVNVELILAVEPDALLLSKRALIYDADQTNVYRLKPDRTVERLILQPRLEDRENIQPAEGFQEGDLIVVAGQTGLKDGASVRLPGDPDELAETNAESGIERAQSTEPPPAAAN